MSIAIGSYKEFEKLQIVCFQTEQWLSTSIAGTPWESMIASAKTSKDAFDAAMSRAVLTRLKCWISSRIRSKHMTGITGKVLERAEIALFDFGWTDEIEKVLAFQVNKGRESDLLMLRHRIHSHVRAHCKGKLKAYREEIEAIRLNGFTYLRADVSAQEWERFKAHRPN